MIRIGVLTVSDSLFRGEREKDESGEEIKNFCRSLGWSVERYGVVPDEEELIAKKLIEWCDEGSVDVIFTTGGTGFSPRDVTPEATRAVMEREAPGFSEIIRIKSYEITPHGIISRGVSGIRKETLIINLPGSRKAVREALEFVHGAIPHAIEKLKGDTRPCGG